MKRSLCPHCKRRLADGERIHQECIDPWADAQAAKAQRKQAKVQRAAQKAEKAEIKARKEKLLGYNDQKRLTQSVINKWVVHVRDASEPCISCGAVSGRWQGGHYRARGSAPHLALDLRNIHKQCYRCNMELHGNLLPYRRALVEKFGEEWVDALECDQQPRRYRVEELIEMRAKFAKALREKSLDV